MSRKRYTPEQIISMLREAEVALAQGQSVGQACRTLGVSEQSYYRWRKEYGLDYPGFDDLHPHTNRVQLEAQCLGEALNGEFGAVVQRPQRESHLSADRRNVDDHTALVRAEMW